ncbi:MAG: patatin-like phospholipase family protein [Hyphomicrobiaceae bacterium]
MDHAYFYRIFRIQAKRMFRALSLHSVLCSLAPLRFPIFVSLVFVLVILVPRQLHEIIKAYLSLDSINLSLQVIRAAIGVCIICLVLLVSSTALVRSASPNYRAHLARHTHMIYAVIATIAIAPMLAFILAICINLPVHNQAVSDVSIQEVVLGFLILYFLFRLYAAWFWRPTEPFVLLSTGASGRLLGRTSLIACLAVMILIVAGVFTPISVAWLAGPFIIISIFFSVLCLAGSRCTQLYDRSQVPMLSILSVLALLCTLSETNNNHEIRISKHAAKLPKDSVNAFRLWLKNRPNLGKYSDSSFPVYIVSAEGGGIYAGAHAAFTLAALQERCSRFSDHLFAISSVSGGSLGAAVFSSLMQGQRDRAADECRPDEASTETGNLQKAVQRYFDRDFLTPLLVAAFFPDFLQRFIPTAIGPLDRARALEKAFEDAAANLRQKNGSTNLFQSDFRSHWSYKGRSPALLMNTTHVGYGDRVVISPFRLTGFKDRAINLLNNKKVPRFSSAVSASARFPIVTPSASVRVDSDTHDLADGGYFENAGIRTAFDLVQTLRKANPARNHGDKNHDAGSCSASNLATVSLSPGRLQDVCFKFITIRSENSDVELGYHGEFAVPVIALYASRTARGRADQFLIEDLFCGGQYCVSGGAGINPHIHTKFLDPAKLGLPLGWTISTESLANIRETLRPKMICPYADGNRIAPNISRVWEAIKEVETACLFWSVWVDLR